MDKLARDLLNELLGQLNIQKVIDDHMMIIFIQKYFDIIQEDSYASGFDDGKYQYKIQESES